MSRPLEKRCPLCGHRQRNLPKHMEACKRQRAGKLVTLPERVAALPDQLNVYACGNKGCGWEMVTIDVHQGTTPAIIACGRCGHEAWSSFYSAEKVAGRKPTHEWYQPLPYEFRSLPRDEREHVANGGLNLRKRVELIVLEQNQSSEGQG